MGDVRHKMIVCGRAARCWDSENKEGITLRQETLRIKMICGI